MSKARATDPYAGMRTRRHWKREDAARALAEWTEGGGSLSSFARRHNLALRRLQWWRAQFEKQPATKRDSTTLLPVVLRQAPLIAIGSGTVGAVSVTIGAARIEVSDLQQTDPGWIAALVTALQGARS